MSLLILFPRRAYVITLMAVSYGGGQGDRDFGDDFRFSDIKKPEVVKKKKLKKKEKVVSASITLGVRSVANSVEEKLFPPAIHGKAWDYEPSPNEVKVKWEELLKPKKLKELTEILDHLGKIQPKHIEKLLKRFEKKVPVLDTVVTLKKVKVLKPIVKKIEVQLPIAQPIVLPKPKPKPTLDFSDEELLLAVHLIEKELKPKVKLDFTDEELLLAIYIMMENKK